MMAEIQDDNDEAWQQQQGDGEAIIVSLPRW
jgi:hypothetical protein